MEYVQAAVGLAMLFAAGDLLVRGAVSAGLKLNIPPILIGLTIVAFGTSAPELLVTIEASLEGAPGIAVGNVVGSNIANVLLVLGLPALLSPLGDHSNETKRNYTIMLFVTIAAIGMCFNAPLTWWQGVLLLSMLGLFLLDTYRCAMTARGEATCSALDEIEEADAGMPVWKVAALIGIGILGLPVAASLTVDAARAIALGSGMTEESIGLTLVALGTSLPELATTLMAAVRGRADVAIGNIIGSNVFNLLCILGVAASMGDIVIPQAFLDMNLWVMLAAAAAMAPFVFMRRKLGRVAGGMFVTAYLVYVAVVLSSPPAPL